jgi:hypothetical protein
MTIFDQALAEARDTLSRRSAAAKMPGQQAA